MIDLPTRVLAALRLNVSTVAVAESLTGGLVGMQLTAAPGASDAFRGGVIAYATDVKASVLGVDAGLLEREGAVHPDVAGQMATGVRSLLGATYGLALTGVAGPDPQDGRPPGSLHVAVDGPAGLTVESPAITATDRAGIRDEAARVALDLLLSVVR